MFSRSARLLARIGCVLLAAGFIGSACAQTDSAADGLALQKAREQSLKADAKGKKPYYTRKWDLSDLPAYQPERTVSGTIRMWGSNYLGDGLLADYWEKAFRKYHPDVKFDYHLKTTLAAIPGLVIGVSDVSPNRKITFSETLLYQRFMNSNPVQITFATGSYDVPGWQPSFGIVVPKDNPIDRLTMEQLDGIFGAERLGGWVGTTWHPEFARGPERNIRSWGQLGLTGDWADKAITPYGATQRYNPAVTMSDLIIKGSDKWNERLRAYAMYVTTDGKPGPSLTDDLKHDRYGIGYLAAPTKDLPPELKVLKIARTTDGPYYEYSMDNLRERKYPLLDEVYFYANSPAGKGIDPKVKEFLRFVLSREGQELVQRDGKYLPLTATIVREQLRKLDEVGKASKAAE